MSPVWNIWLKVEHYKRWRAHDSHVPVRRGLLVVLKSYRRALEKGSLKVNLEEALERLRQKSEAEKETDKIIQELQVCSAALRQFHPSPRCTNQNHDSTRGATSQECTAKPRMFFVFSRTRT